MRSMGSPSTAKQLAGLIDKYAPEIGSLARATIDKMRSRLPGAIELVYDNYNALAVAFSPTERTSDVILSITLYPRWVSLFFMRGAQLPDPHKLLKGSGRTVQHIVLEDAAALDKPAVRALIASALRHAAKPLDAKGPRRIVIKLISAKQRSRRTR